MRFKPSAARRPRTSRFAHRLFIGIACALAWLVAAGGYLVWRTMGENTGRVVHRGGASGANGNGATVTGLPVFDADGNAEAGDETSALLQRDLGAMPYSESLEELLRLLRLYAAKRGVTVNSTYEAPLEAAITAAGAGAGDFGLDQIDYAGQPVSAGLRMQELGVLREIYERQKIAPSVYLTARWVLDAPDVIAAEQETYVERYLVPTNAAVQPTTPLQVIEAYYNAQDPSSLHRMAADTEKSMNDDGYATYIQRSSTFFDASHAARRGYGQEGSIFVAVPFALADITADMVDAIQRRALNRTSTVPLTPAEAAAGAAAAAASPGPDGKPQESDGSAHDDGFGEVPFTAARCAMTVESVFRHANRGVAVTVGTIDIVSVAGIASAADMHVHNASAVLIPLRAADRAPLAAARERRYSTITCEPPNFRSGWHDAEYGFRWKDNLRRRRVVVPLTKLTRTRGTDPAATASNAQAPQQQQQQQQRRLEESFAFPHVGRYAALQLYRGESYVLLLNAGTQMLPNWDLTVRLLYLRTPQRERAVLTSRPTPGVTWRAMATAMIKTWDTTPFLRLSHAATVAAASPPPPLDEAAQRLLAELPREVSTWLTAARADPAVALWLVTPAWLWPSVSAALAGWVHVSSAKAATDAGNTATATSSAAAFFDVFRDDVVRRVLDSSNSPTVAAPRIPGDLRDVTVDFVKDAAAGAGAATTPPRVRVTRAGPAGGSSPTSPPISGESLSPSEMYQLLFSAERHPPLPSQPVVDMTQTTSTTTVAPPAPPDAATVPVCGSAASVAPFYTATTQTLLKRSFEYCWLNDHLKALRAAAQELVRATSATTVLTTSPGEAGAGLRKCGGEGNAGAAGAGSRALFAHSMVVSRVSTSLADMRYLEPRDPTTAESEAAGGAAVLSAAQVGKMEGSPSPQSPPPPPLPAAAAAAAAAGVAPPRSSTPYVLQSVASADFLFAPAEAFFNFPAEHRLRTRPRTLSEQQQQAGRASAVPHNASNTSAAGGALAHGVPEAIQLDPSLQFLDGDLADAYVTHALWTRGWNLFGLTEPVAVGTGEPPHVSLGVRKVAKAADGDVCEVGGDATAAAAADAAADIPEALQRARVYTLDKFWALVHTCRASGTPFGAAVDADAGAAAAAAKAKAAAAHPLRRTLSEWESFSGVTLAALQERMKAP